MKLFGKKGVYRRYEENLLKLNGFDGYIFGQNSPAVAALRYGSADTRVERTGCGAAAVYNALNKADVQVNFAEVLRDCELMRLTFFGGIFGTKTRKLGRLFDFYRVPCRECRKIEEFLELLPACRAAVVCVWNEKLTDGIHFFCVYPDADGGFKSLNRFYSDRALVFEPGSLRRDRFIISYVI